MEAANGPDGTRYGTCSYSMVQYEYVLVKHAARYGMYVGLKNTA